MPGRVRKYRTGSCGKHILENVHMNKRGGVDPISQNLACLNSGGASNHYWISEVLKLIHTDGQGG
jgi:hypothetical protein